ASGRDWSATQRLWRPCALCENFCTVVPRTSMRRVCRGSHSRRRGRGVEFLGNETCMTLEQLRIFVAVAERQHMTRAAEALNLTQQAVSAAIAALENAHATALFHRVGRRIELTEAGRLFLDEARSVLTRAAAAELALSELGGLKRGTITVNASQTIA